MHAFNTCISARNTGEGTEAAMEVKRDEEMRRRIGDKEGELTDGEKPSSLTGHFLSREAELSRNEDRG